MFFTILSMEWSGCSEENISSPHLSSKAAPITVSDSFTDLASWALDTDTCPPTPDNTANISSAQSFSGETALQMHFFDDSSCLRIYRNISPKKTGAVSIWFYDDMQQSAGAGIEILDKSQDPDQVVAVGVNTEKYGNYFYRAGDNNFNSDLDSKVPRSPGWHHFELVSTSKGSYGKIDGINLSYLPTGNLGLAKAVNTRLNGFDQIAIFNTWSGSDDYYWDEFAVSDLPAIPTGIRDGERHFLEVFAKLPFVPATLPYDPSDPYANLQTDIRGKAIRALVLAVLQDPAYSTEAKNLLVEVTNTSGNWGSNWISPTTTAPYALASWMLWDQFSQQEKVAIYNVVAQEANYWIGLTQLPLTDPNHRPKTGFDPDTEGEVHAWAAGFFSIADSMFSGHADWATMAKIFAFHTFTTGETDPYINRYTQTVFSNSYLVKAHSWYPHPNYGPANIYLLAGALANLKIGRSIPSEFSHNILNVWNAHEPYIDSSNFLFKNILDSLGNNENTGKDDWCLDARYLNGARAFLEKVVPGGGASAYSLDALLNYELAVAPDLVMYPVDASISVPCPTDNAACTINSRKYERNAAAVLGDAYAYLLNDDSISLSPIPPKTQEVCDGVDNDWDGAKDNGVLQSCYSGPSGTQGVGICKAGTNTCIVGGTGTWSGCLGEITPAAQEICGNGLDDDCNWVQDDPSICSSPQDAGWNPEVGGSDGGETDSNGNDPGGNDVDQMEKTLGDLTGSCGCSPRGGHSSSGNFWLALAGLLIGYWLYRRKHIGLLDEIDPPESHLFHVCGENRKLSVNLKAEVP